MISIPLWFQGSIWIMYIMLTIKEIVIIAALWTYPFHQLNKISMMLHVLWVIFTALWIPWNVQYHLG